MPSDLSRVRVPIAVPLVSLVCLVSLVALLPLVLALPVAAEVEIFRLESREGALQGESESVAVGPLGELRLAPEVDRVVGLEEPFVFSAAPLEGGPFGTGWILGTGNDGKIVHVGSDGTADVLARTEEPTVFAVLGTGDGEVVAAGSPEGTVSKVVKRDGERVLEPILDPDATYVWALAEDAEGRLLVATGLPGRLLRFDRRGDGVETLGVETFGVETLGVETLWESPDDHVRALLVHSDGSLWIGTAGQGRIVRIGEKGAQDVRARTIYDASHPEVLSFAEGADGAVYAALLASEASFVDLAGDLAGNLAGNREEESVTPSGEVAVGSRTTGFEGSRSAVMRFDADGRHEEVASLENETIHSLLWHAGDLWIGTGQEGALYRLRGDVLVREAELDDRQIVGLARAGGEVGIATTNGAAVHRLASRPAAEGTYTSAVLDAGARARFGVFRWRGETRGGRVGVAVRSGSSAEPDVTWSDWRQVARDLAPGEDGEISSEDDGAGVARYVQWRATLHRGGDRENQDGPRLVVAELSYRQENRAPEITSFGAMAPGAILVEQSFNPTSTVFEPWSPSRQGIFTTIGSERQGEGARKELWKQGWRTLRWEAKDANEDELLYALAFRRQDDGDDGEDLGWLPMAENLEQSYYSFDARVLPDGIYRFRLEASDAGSRTDDEAARVRKVSEPVTVDHAPPRLLSRSAIEGGVEVRLADAASPIRSVSLSLDAGPWKDLRPVDGLLDGHRETLRLEIPSDARVALLRVMDASFNVVTFDLSAGRDEE